MSSLSGSTTDGLLNKIAGELMGSVPKSAEPLLKQLTSKAAS